jgi:phosphoribosylanthranilate isomerase
VSLWIKICGVTSLEDALMVEQAGADAIGLNFAVESPRRVDVATARQIATALYDKLEIVGVFVNATLADITTIANEVGLDTAQLHGAESPELLAQVSQLVPAYKALRIGIAEDVAEAGTYGGDRLLVDAKVPGALGGTGHTFDWSLIERLNEERKIIVAGGLNPENIEDCVRRVLPYGIDTASGVELSPRKKSAEKVMAFIQTARRG